MDHPSDYYRELDLDTWLRTTTGDLCAEARGRISREIHDHYSEAYHNELALGMTRLQAHRVAMGALGEPKAARRAFRRTYLTWREADWLKRGTRRLLRGQYKPTTRLFLIVVCVLPSVSLLVWMTQYCPELASFWVKQYCVIGLTYCIQGELAPRLLKQGRIRRALLWEETGQIFFGLALFLIVFGLGKEPPFSAWVGWASAGGLLMVPLVKGIWSHRFWSKLGKGAPHDFDLRGV